MTDIVTQLFGGEYWWARFLFQRGLAVIYLVAFLVALHQFRPLLGETGLLPVPQFLKAIHFNQAPSIFHFLYSDRFLLIVVWIGIALSFFALIGMSERFSWWASALVWGCLWVLYLSIVNVGQTFYSFGWESLLLEVGFLAIFMGASKNPVPLLMIFLLRWVLFRLEFGAGLIKIRGDECWRDLTCLNYHHETQPMPNPLSWYFHNLPPGIHKLETLGNHFFQLVAPWGLFLPQPIAAISAGLIILSQLWLILSGNFSWLNWIAIVLAFSGFTNAQLGRIPLFVAPAFFSRALAHQGVVLFITMFVVVLSWWPLRNMFSKRQLMNASFNQYHIVNTYGAFGSVTKERYEIVIEGTDVEEVSEDTQWKEYEFKGKPGDPMQRPPQYAPYHLRLDWLMWFQAFHPPGSYERWFVALIEKLLGGDEATLALLAKNPFPDTPPRFVRVQYYLYHFTTPGEREETGAWWKREFVSEYLSPVRLQ